MVFDDDAYIVLLAAGDFCKFNSLDGRSVDAMLTRTERQKVAEALFLRSPARGKNHTLPRDESLLFCGTSLHRKSNLAVSVDFPESLCQMHEMGLAFTLAWCPG